MTKSRCLLLLFTLSSVAFLWWDWRAQLGEEITETEAVMPEQSRPAPAAVPGTPPERREYQTAMEEERAEAERVIVAGFPPATLMDFPEETREIVRAVESGQPIRVTLGDGEVSRWTFRPAPSVTEDFVVSTGMPGEVPTALRSYAARNLDGDSAAGHHAFLSVAGNRAAMMIFREDGILHLVQNEAGEWRMEMETANQHAPHLCAMSEDGIYTTGLADVLVPWREENWTEVSVDPEWAASYGENPFTGDLTMTDRPIPYGRQYAESLRSVVNLFVVENAGANTLANTSALTARYLTLSASLHAMFEQQLGVNFLTQELILIVSGSDFESPAIYNPGGTGSGADLGPFGTWLSTHRSHTTYQWSLATKIGRVHSANGRAYTSSTNTPSGRNVNNAPGFSLVGHEIGHNFGANHTQGGIMNASLANGARDFFRPVGSTTAAKEIHTHLSSPIWWQNNAPRTFGIAPIRDPVQIPFARDNFAVTGAGRPVQISVLENDSLSAPFGQANETLRVIETGPVFPPHAGTLSHSESHVSFAPSEGFIGSAFFSYTIRGDLGNNDQGWLHRADVAVQVENPSAAAPMVTAVRGPAATHHDNERVILSWVDQGNVPFEWEIQRSVNTGPFVPVAVVAGTSPNWIDINITRSASVAYRVRARDNSGEPGAWGVSDMLAASTDPHAFWDDFSSGTLTGWETWTNAPDSIAPNDAPPPHFSFDVSAGRARLQSPGGAARLGLLVRPVVQDLSQTGALSMSASLQMSDVHTWHRVLAWIDDGGAVLWIGLERNRDNNNTRKARLYGANSLAEFFQEVGNYNSTAQLFQNTQNGNVGFAIDHRATLTVSPGSVGMTVVPMDIGNTSRRASPVSTLGLMDPGLSNFTGVGRFAIGGFSNQTSGTTINFFADHVSVTSLPVPQKYLPAMVDDFLRLKPGEAATLRPTANDIGVILNPSLHSSPAGWQVHRQSHGADLWTLQSPPDALPGVYEVVLRSQADNYQANNDGLTGFSTVYVTVEDTPAQANDLFYTKYRGEGPFSIFPLSNDVLSGFHGLANLDPRTATGNSAGVMNNSHRLVSATLLTPGLGSLEVPTLRSVINGVITERPSGELRFSWDASAPAGIAEIEYTFEDSRGQQDTGTVSIQLLPTNAPRITEHPLSTVVDLHDPFTLSVSATGSGLTYEWQRDGVPIPGATEANFSVTASGGSDAGIYQVQVSNSYGTVVSQSAVVAVVSTEPEAPEIISHPQSQTVAIGQSVSFSVTVTGDPEPQLQWRKDGVDIAGATQATFSIASAVLDDAGDYSVFAWNSEGEAISDIATLTVAVPPPVPTGLTATAVSFDQIDLNWTDPSDPSESADAFRIERSADGSTWSTLTTVTGTAHSDTGLTGGSTWHYRVIALRDGQESAPSASASATTPMEPAAPVITQAPQAQTVLLGGTAVFTVVATGAPAPGYQWYVNNTLIPEATAATLEVVDVQFEDEGLYHVRVSNSEGGVESDPIWLEASVPPPGGVLFARVNFQTNTDAPEGWLRDIGEEYGDRGNGFHYGWSGDNTGTSRLRSAFNGSDFLHNTLLHMQNGGSFSWQIAIPNGSYQVRIVAGDAGHFDSVFKINVEDTLVVDGTPDTNNRWIEGVATVDVSDGFLNVTNAAGASNNKICFIEIYTAPSDADGYDDWAVNLPVGQRAKTHVLDGVPNLLRYAFGGDETTPASFFRLQAQASSNGMQLSFPRIDDLQLTYEIWGSQDLADWGAAPVWSGVGDGVTTFTLENQHPLWFLHLRVNYQNP